MKFRKWIYGLACLSGLMSSASAHIIDVNDLQRIVYYTTTPSLQVEMTDLDEDGGGIQWYPFY